MNKSLKILPTDLLEEYIKYFPPTAIDDFNSLEDSELSVDTFSFYTSVSAVFSSKIEGEDIDFQSFVKHKRYGVEYQPDYTRKIDDLYNAYLLAQTNELKPENMSAAHAKLTANILKPAQQGKFRTAIMYVITDSGRIEYVAAVPSIVEVEMQKLYADIRLLLAGKLSFAEVFFYAAMMHLMFVKIHPFNDGNGRTARLLEKWFLAEKLGNKAWFLQSERYYYDNHQVYYQSIRKLGLEYEELNFAEALPFLQLLPNAIHYLKEE